MIGEQKNTHSQLQLTNAIKANDEKVLKQLYVSNFHKTQMYILKNNGSMPQAKDTYQEAFIVVWQNIKEGKFTPQNETAIQGYLYQIAKNKWTDYLRSSQYKKTTKLNPLITEADDDDFLKQESLSEDSKRQQQTTAAFKQLGRECRELLTVFYFNKKSLREIASQYNIAEASARNKKYRCLQKLRQLALNS